MKRKRLFFNDLLALAFACIVSLLFTHGVTQFVNTTSKKQNESAVTHTQHTRSEVDVLYFSETTNHIKSPVEAFHTAENSLFFFQTESSKIIRPLILNIALVWKRIQSQPRTIPPLYQPKLQGEIWSPSISIAQRKLLI